MKPPRPTLPPWMTAGADGLDAYVDLLATDGVDHGLIGPREVPRLWTRHILNCAVVAEPSLQLVPSGTRVADVGSGAGLPGLVWAIVRPDISVVLVEPLLRRSTFLTGAIERLGLADRVQVVRGRAEDVARSADWVPADVVTARAVAPLDRLLTWTIPLVRTEGRLVALKGSSAADEITASAEIAGSMAVRDLHVVLCGAGIVDPPTTVVVGVRGAAE